LFRKNKHLISAAQIDIPFLDAVFALTEKMENIADGKILSELLKGKIMASLFYEPSTRTHLSFNSACASLGGKFIEAVGVEFSSLSKGETIEDTMRMVEKYSDIIVMRHKSDNSAEKASSILKKPFINAGSGKDEHPTQGLLDAFTIKRELGRLDNLKIALVGDLKNGRTVHTLAQLMSQYKNNSFSFVAPDELQMPQKYCDIVKQRNCAYDFSNLTQAIQEADVLYMTRLQTERMDGNTHELLRQVGYFTLGLKEMEFAKENMIVMHPLPRVGEVSSEIDNDPRAVYFKQAGYGRPLRMALLALMLLSRE
jgi:aspartate carbamoyltransferase catalytic subunit